MQRRDFARLAAALPLAASAQADEREELIRKAMRAIRDAAALAERDPERPRWHFRPPSQWNNDPNGTIFHNGWHHLFYQQNPFDTVWGHMHWGHARSRDLVDWEHLPVALWPSLAQGEQHVFSGAAILHGTQPVIFYTSIGKRDPEQWLATPRDGELLHWDKSPANPVLTQRLHGDWRVHEWRDPFLFREDGRTYMVCGGNHDPKGGHATVELYLAENPELTQWTHRGTIFRHPDRSAWNVECPNLFRLGDRWVLLISPHRPCEYFVGDLDLENARFVPDRHGVLDAGDVYATNITPMPSGETILWLWAKTGTPHGRGWNGAMAVPRLLTIGDDGHLRQTPAPAFARLRDREQFRQELPLDNDAFPLGDSESFDCELTLSAASAKAVGLRVGGETIEFDPRSGRLTAGGFTTFAARDREIRLRVLRDQQLLEIFANDGAAVLTTNIARGSGGQLAVFARDGAARLVRARWWQMRAARFSMDHFQEPA